MCYGVPSLCIWTVSSISIWGTLARLLTVKLEEHLSSLSIPCSSLSQKPLCPQFPWLCSHLGYMCVKLLHRKTSISLMQFLLWKQQTTNDGYMTTCPKLGLQPNSFPGSTNRLAINQVRIHWESGKEATLCHSNPQKHEESCLTGTLVLQGVVTYMSHVEAFATRIKTESSDQSPFWGANQGIKETSELLKSMDQEHTAAIWPLTLWKSSAQEPQKGKIKWLSTLSADQKPWSWLQTLE